MLFNRLQYKLAPVGLSFLCLLACNSQKKEQEEQLPGLSEVGLVDEVSVYSGRLYSSGLSPQEASSLNLAEPVYQISGGESYFFSGSDSLSAYMGSCIAIEGSLKSGWEGMPERLNKQYTYGRGALEVEKLKLQSSESCKADPVKGEEKPVKGVRTYSGELQRMERPAPDIAYDYLLLLDEPFVDEYHPVQPGKLVRELPIVVFTAEQLQKIEAALQQKKKVRLQAAMVQGYAERKALQLREVVPLD